MLAIQKYIKENGFDKAVKVFQLKTREYENKVLLKYFLIFLLFGCNQRKEPNDLGVFEKLPKGEYVIWNTGSRHIVKCLKSDGKIYWLNDADFDVNGIDGYDAHQYYDKTKIIIE